MRKIKEALKETKFKIGDRVIWEGAEFEILGWAASKDIWGLPLVEIAWNDYDASPTGYLAVSQRDLELAEKV